MEVWVNPAHLRSLTPPGCRFANPARTCKWLLPGLARIVTDTRQTQTPDQRTIHFRLHSLERIECQWTGKPFSLFVRTIAPIPVAWQSRWQDGKAIDLRGDPNHPFTAGFLCGKVARYLERVYHPERLLHPLRRIGPKTLPRRRSATHFERIGWDEALDTIARKFKDIAASAEGPQAILPYSYAGTMGRLQGGSLDRRFFHRLGASLLDRTICSAAGMAGCDVTLGTRAVIDPEAVVHSRYIINWGSNTSVTNMHLWAHDAPGAQARSQDRHHRSVPLQDRPAQRLVAADPSRHRRRPRPGHDARHLARRLAGRRLPGALLPRRPSSCASAPWPNIRPSRSPPSPAFPRPTSSGWPTNTPRSDPA